MYRNFTEKNFSKYLKSKWTYASISFCAVSSSDVALEMTFKHDACLWTTEVIVGVCVWLSV